MFPIQLLMCGLPFNVTAREIEMFFQPLRCTEIKVRLCGFRSGIKICFFHILIDISSSPRSVTVMIVVHL